MKSILEPNPNLIKSKAKPIKEVSESDSHFSKNSDAIDESKSQVSINYNRSELMFIINTYYDIGDLTNSVKELESLLAVTNFQLTEKERNLYMIVNKAQLNLMRKKMNSLKEKHSFNNPNIISMYIKDTILTAHIAKIEYDLRGFAQNVVDQIEEILEKTNQDNLDAQVFFNKLKADYLKYILEIIDDEEDRQRVEYECQSMYQLAYELCNNLPPHSPLTLSVILNYSVFLYYVNNDTQLALDIAESGYINSIIKMNGRMIKEVNHTMSVLSQNIDIWKKELAVKNNK